MPGRTQVTVIRKVAPGLSDRATATAVRAALRAGRGTGAVTVVWTGDAEVRRLNRRWRGKDRTTDVLSFPLGDAAHAGELGDIVISVPEARREAAREDRRTRDELLLLLVHGTLHLLGHDHMRPAERRRMFRLQDAVLRRLGCAPAVFLAS